MRPNLNYLAFYTNNGTPDFISGTISSTSVPFEFSPGWGLMLVAGSFGLRQLQRQLVSKNI